MQLAIQAATAAVMKLREADTGTTSGTSMANVGEAHRHRYSRPALMQPSFNWNAPDKYVELLSFEMDVLNILQTKTYELNDKEKVPIS